MLGWLFSWFAGNRKQEAGSLEEELFHMEEQLDIPSHSRWHNSKPKQK